MGFRGNNASSRRIVLLAGAFWVHGASKVAILGASFLLCFRVWEGMLPPGGVSHEPCFRQVHCFVQGPLRFFPVLPDPTCTRSHIWGLPIFCGASNAAPPAVAVEKVFTIAGLSASDKSVAFAATSGQTLSTLTPALPKDEEAEPSIHDEVSKCNQPGILTERWPKRPDPDCTKERQSQSQRACLGCLSHSSVANALDCASWRTQVRPHNPFPESAKAPTDVEHLGLIPAVTESTTPGLI